MIRTMNWKTLTGEFERQCRFALDKLEDIGFIQLNYILINIHIYVYISYLVGNLDYKIA